jgi:hypothetical protein
MDEPNGVTLQALTSLPVQTKGERPIRWAIGNYQLPFECQARQLSKRLMDFQKLKRIANLNFTKNSPLQNELQSRPALEIGVSSKLRRKTKDKKLKKKKVFSLSSMFNN